MSLHDELMAEYAVPSHLENFAERDANGDFGGVKYWRAAATEGEQGVPWVASVGALDLDESNEDGNSSHQEREQREIVVLQGPTPDVPFQKNGMFEVTRYGETRFSIERIERGATLTTVRAYRYATEALQRRGVERGK